MLEIKTVTNGTQVCGKAFLTVALEKISRESIVTPCPAVTKVASNSATSPDA
jgi:hypothetical protein